MLPRVVNFINDINLGNLPKNDMLPMVTYFIDDMLTLLTCLQMICCPW